MSDTLKLSANLSRVVLETLKELAQKRGVSMTEVLRQAIPVRNIFKMQPIGTRKC